MNDFSGICIKDAIKIWDGERLLVTTEDFSNLLDRNLYYMDKDYSYGILKLSKGPDKYTYEIKIIDRFESPQRVKSEENVFVSDIRFLSEKELDVRKKDDKWCVTHPDGSIIYNFPTKSDADKMRKAIMLSQSRKVEDFSFLGEMSGGPVIGSCVVLILNQEHKPIQIQIKMKEDSFVKSTIESRLKNILPKELHDLDIVWDNEEYPNFIPLFDLQLKEIKPSKIITIVRENSSSCLMQPYSPQKPSPKNYYKLNNLMEVLI